MTPEMIEKLSSPEEVDQLLATPQSYGNGYDCCDQQVALAHALRDARAEIKKFREFIKGVKQFEPRTDIYAHDLMDECNDVLGLCRCCGEKVCEEE